MRPRSRKMTAQYVLRRRLVAELLESRPMCERCGVRRSTEVHEVLSRARGGSIVSADNCVALCHEDHRWVTENPAAAHAEGFLRHSWEAS